MANAIATPAPLVGAGNSGDALVAYERRLAAAIGATHAVAFAYGRTALCSILRASGLTKGDEVILSPLTCKVVPLTLLSLDLKPVYVDVSGTTLNLDPQQVEAAFGPRTRAVLTQRTYGLAGGIDDVAKIARARNHLVVDDCAQCLPLGTAIRTASNTAHASIVSTNLMKPLPAGSGGAAITNDGDLAGRVRALRDACQASSAAANLRLRAAVWVHDHLLRSRSYWTLFELNRRLDVSYRVRPLDAEIQTEILETAVRPTDYQARRGLKALSRIHALADHRRQCCVAYADALGGLSGVAIPAVDVSGPLYYFPVLVERKPALLAAARRRHVEIVGWPRSTPIYPLDDPSALRTYGYEVGDCPTAEWVASRLVGLPTHDKICATDRARAIALVAGTTESHGLL